MIVFFCCCSPRPRIQFAVTAAGNGATSVDKTYNRKHTCDMEWRKHTSARFSGRHRTQHFPRTKLSNIRFSLRALFHMGDGTQQYLPSLKYCPCVRWKCGKWKWNLWPMTSIKAKLKKTRYSYERRYFFFYLTRIRDWELRQCKNVTRCHGLEWLWKWKNDLQTVVGYHTSVSLPHQLNWSSLQHTNTHTNLPPQLRQSRLCILLFSFSLMCKCNRINSNHSLLITTCTELCVGIRWRCDPSDCRADVTIFASQNWINKIHPVALCLSFVFVENLFSSFHSHWCEFAWRLNSHFFFAPIFHCLLWKMRYMNLPPLCYGSMQKNVIMFASRRRKY